MLTSAKLALAKLALALPLLNTLGEAALLAVAWLSGACSGSPKAWRLLWSSWKKNSFKPLHLLKHKLNQTKNGVRHPSLPPRAHQGLRLSTGTIIHAELRLPLTPSTHLLAQTVNSLNPVPAMVELGPYDLEQHHFTSQRLSPPNSSWPTSRCSTRATKTVNKLSHEPPHRHVEAVG